MIAADLVGRGYRVGLIDRDEQRLAVLESELKDLPVGESLMLPTDLGDSQARSRAVAAVESAWGGIDAVVNTAGIGPGIRPDFFTEPIRSSEISEEDLRRSLEINTLAPLMLCIEVLPGMRQRGWGRLVNVTTSLTTMVRNGFLTYGPSKAALEAATSILAKECDDSGVTMNVVVPGGPADTPMVPAESRGTASLIPAEAMVDPVAYLLSDNAGGANGIRIVASEWEAGRLPDPASLAPVAW
ncbi:hypothetical protein AXA44_43640 [Rhodococcus sp. SC4]|nr:hypothetical protein AXA44_43640 [Rhodococcus sp. SC4]